MHQDSSCGLDSVPERLLLQVMWPRLSCRLPAISSTVVGKQGQSIAFSFLFSCLSFLFFPFFPSTGPYAHWEIKGRRPSVTVNLLVPNSRVNSNSSFFSHSIPLSLFPLSLPPPLAHPLPFSLPLSQSLSVPIAPGRIALQRIHQRPSKKRGCSITIAATAITVFGCVGVVQLWCAYDL